MEEVSSRRKRYTYSFFDCYDNCLLACTFPYNTHGHKSTLRLMNADMVLFTMSNN